MSEVGGGAAQEELRPGDVERDAAYRAVCDQLANPPPVARRTQVLLISLGLFMLAWLARGGDHPLRDLTVLVAVLLVHEGGHALAMRLSGYTDVRVFFIPFFGAAAAGKKRGVARWKEGVVLLAGPLPGLVIGAAMLAAGVDELARNVALILVIVNALNLLPIAPLDGGQLFQLVLFSRNRHLEIGFLVVAGVALIAGYLITESFVTAIFGGLVLIAATARARLLAVGVELAPLGLPDDLRALDDGQRRALFDEAWRLSQPRARQPRLLAGTVEALHEIAVRRPVSGRASALLIVGWLAGWGVTAFAAVHAFGAQPSHWAYHHDTAGRFSVELPAEPTAVRDGEVTTLTARRGPRHEYAVVWRDVPIAGAWVPATRASLLRDGKLVRELAESELLIELDGSIAHVLLVERGGRGYAVIATAPRDEPESERVIRSFRVHDPPPSPPASDSPAPAR